MIEKLAYIWEEIVFYGPAAASFFAVLASGLVGLVLWMIIRRRK